MYLLINMAIKTEEEEAIKRYVRLFPAPKNV